MTDRWSEFTNLNNFEAAWDHVAANKGCAGVDGETIAHFARSVETYLPALRRAVFEDSYHPLPLKQLYIPKKQGG
jgi:CRISP-associated protein Cas1